MKKRIKNDRTPKRSSGRSRANQPEPQVGIFWLVGERLMIAGLPLTKAEADGEFVNFPTSHIDSWSKLQQQSEVPPEAEYEEYPRGRIVYNTKTKQFSLMADRCILRNAAVIREILSKMHLPKNTKRDSDYHYRCAKCLYGDQDAELD